MLRHVYSTRIKTRIMKVSCTQSKFDDQMSVIDLKDSISLQNHDTDKVSKVFQHA